MSKTAPFLLVCLFSCWCTAAHSQYYFYDSRYYDALLTVELGVSAGAMNCLTDLGGRHEKGRNFFSDVNRSATHPCGGLFAGVNYNNKIGIRAELAYGQVSASDSILKRYTPARNGRYMRNLSFRSDIREVSLVTELYPVSFFPGINLPLLPYLAAGIGCFSFHPQAFWNGSWASLPPLHTEGEGWKEYPDRPLYKLSQMNIPAGGGIRYEPHPLISVRCEFIYRWLFTDYLDDVSTTYISPSLFDTHLRPPVASLASKLADRQRREAGYPSAGHDGERRGNSRNKDAFFSLSIQCSFVLGRSKIR